MQISMRALLPIGEEETTTMTPRSTEYAIVPMVIFARLNVQCRIATSYLENCNYR